jgi:hypothetical protein
MAKRVITKKEMKDLIQTSVLGDDPLDDFITIFELGYKRALKDLIQDINLKLDKIFDYYG